MTELLTYFISTFFFSLFMFRFFLLKNNADLLKIYDYPNNRKIHDKKILKIGGIGILFSSQANPPIVYCPFKLI